MYRIHHRLPIVIIWIVICFFITARPAHARGDLSAERLKDAMDKGTPMLLLNPLSDIEFNEAHIPGSVNIPLHTIMKTDKLPKDKDMLIVTYCLGPK